MQFIEINQEFINHYYDIICSRKTKINREIVCTNPQPNKKQINVNKGYCTNCGIKGHNLKSCKEPITSFGIIPFKIVKNSRDEFNDTNETLNKILYKYNIAKSNKYPKIKFLAVQRKDTIGYIDTIRGKYPTTKDREIEKNLLLQTFIKEMTITEKNRLYKVCNGQLSFKQLWNDLWVNHLSKCYLNEYETSEKKFNKLLPQLKLLLDHQPCNYFHTEFTFAKGRRGYSESEISCAEREFTEETGFDKKYYQFITNYPKIIEEFTGTNGIRYKHIYYLVKMKEPVHLLPHPHVDPYNIIQKGEIQNVGWFTYEELMTLIRPYDIAKKKVLTKLYKDLYNTKTFKLSDFYTDINKRRVIY